MDPECRFRYAGRQFGTPGLLAFSHFVRAAECVPVPEPSALALSLAAVGIGVRVLRKK
jgi:hypothetical protein